MTNQSYTEKLATILMDLANAVAEATLIHEHEVADVPALDRAFKAIAALNAEYYEPKVEKSRYCTVCFDPCFWTQGGWKCVTHGYAGNDLMTKAKASKLKSKIRGVR